MASSTLYKLNLYFFCATTFGVFKWDFWGHAIILNSSRVVEFIIVLKVLDSIIYKEWSPNLFRFVYPIWKLSTDFLNSLLNTSFSLFASWPFPSRLAIHIFYSGGFLFLLQGILVCWNNSGKIFFLWRT